jgi:hypothetical protein
MFLPVVNVVPFLRFTGPRWYLPKKQEGVVVMLGRLRYLLREEKKSPNKLLAPAGANRSGEGNLNMTPLYIH